MNELELSDARMDRPEELLEASWSTRGRTLANRELVLEVGVTAAFVAAVIALFAVAPASDGPHPMVALVMAAYALSARVRFPLGAGSVLPTQLFLVPLFVLAPAHVAPLLVFAALVASTLGMALGDRSRLDRIVYCGGDAMHALGPALVLVLLADGDAATAGVLVVLLAFLAQLAFDFASSSVHDWVVFGLRPTMQLRVVGYVWAVDAALAPFGLLTAALADDVPLAALAPLPLVLLLYGMARERSRRIEEAHTRLRALQHERKRHQGAVQRLGEAFASNLDRDALLQIATRAAVEALDAEAGRARLLGGDHDHQLEPVPGAPTSAQVAALEAAEALAASSPGAAVTLEHDGWHLVASAISEGPTAIATVAVARRSAFDDDERALLANLLQQAAVSADNATQHERLRTAEARLRHQAFHDGLTGLANRALFADRVEHALRRHERSDREMAALFIDLDGFKLVNDTLGHDSGDELLVAVGNRITASLRGGDTAARLGGDEFAVLLEDLADSEQADVVADRLRRNLAAPMEIGGHECTVKASVGLASATPDLGHSELLRRADLAMYTAKRAGGDRVSRFQDDVVVRADTRLELRHDLQGAVGRGEFELLFQPIVRLADGAVAIVEALVRWRHPRRGLLSPADFITLAEETGTIDELGRFVLDEACRTAAGWARAPGCSPQVSVNVSAAQLGNPQLAADVAATLRRHGVSPSRLVLEVTESVAVEPDRQTEENLRSVHSLGVALALDDFGTGYSSLSYLGRLPIDLLKLDRTFLDAIDRDPAQARLVGGIIELASSLGMSVVAEGIERPDQLARVAELGSTLGQGFLLDGPMDADSLARRLAPATAHSDLSAAAA